MITVGIVGGAGYLGGELLRILLGHPEVTVAAVTSTRLTGRRVQVNHPNLRGLTDLSYVSPHHLPPCDVLFLTTPGFDDPALHARLTAQAKVVYDLSPVLRLRDPEQVHRYYGRDHAPLASAAAFGCPELNRDTLRTADLVSVPGCMATAAILALAPLSAQGLLEPRVYVDGRVGSSGSGASGGAMNAHSERSGVLRVYAPLGHRHEPEIAQATGLEVRMSATGVDAVRGVQVLCRAAARPGCRESAVLDAYRRHYAQEPFVRLVWQRRGDYRYPEPKILAGSNYCDVGFALAPDGRDLVVMAALDNLVKGGAGNAVQCLNVRMGWNETTGLGFPGLHPA